MQEELSVSPVLVGPAEALKIMLSGRHIPAVKALDMGVIDSLSEGDIVEDAVAFAKDVAEKNETHPLVRNLNEKVLAARGDENIISEARALAAKARKGQFAPGKIIQCVEAAINLDDFDEGMKKEAEYFIECLLKSSKRGNDSLSFLVKELPQRLMMFRKRHQKMDINKAGIIGSGTMGGGIAMCFATLVYRFILLIKMKKTLKKGLAAIERNYKFMVDRGRMSAEQMEKTFGLISSGLSYEEISDVDIVIEAVYENLDLKLEIFKKLDEAVKDDAILASNTSGLDVDALADCTKRPEKVVGTHFFSPANVMRLLEVVRGEKTSNETLATIMSLGKALKKAPVVSLNAPGFIGNRMLFGYTTQANKLLLEGALPHQVDSALENFGMSMGPFECLTSLV